jgi:hypothetical protein
VVARTLGVHGAAVSLTMVLGTLMARLLSRARLEDARAADGGADLRLGDARSWVAVAVWSLDGRLRVRRRQLAADVTHVGDYNHHEWLP